LHFPSELSVVLCEVENCSFFYLLSVESNNPLGMHLTLISFNLDSQSLSRVISVKMSR